MSTNHFELRVHVCTFLFSDVLDPVLVYNWVRFIFEKVQKPIEIKKGRKCRISLPNCLEHIFYVFVDSHFIGVVLI